MALVLRIDASARTEGSKTKELGDYFETIWQRKTQDKFIRRALSTDSIGHIQPQTINGYYTPPEQMTDALKAATALSDSLIDELHSADTLLITTPIYNFSIPSALKAWIDQIVRINRTFSYDGAQFGGLVNCQRAYIICAYGGAGYLNDGPLSGHDFLRPYLTTLLSFLGIQDIEFVGVEGTTADESTVSTNMATTKQAIDTMLSAS